MQFHTTICALAAMAFLLTGCSESDQQMSDAATETIAEALDDSALEHAEKHLDPKYVCPMHPQIIKDEPGSCPICGMDLVAKQIDRSGDAPVISVSGEMIQSMGIRTGRVERTTLWKFIETVGQVEYDETRIAHVHPRAEGWIEQLDVRAESEPVEKGQLLGKIYSPEILDAQVDFLIALQSSGQTRLDQARNGLRLLDVPEETIREIEKTRETQRQVPILAPASGILTRLGVREGMYAAPSTEIFTIADLDSIWVKVDIFEHQMAWIEPGLSAEITVPAWPGKRWEGEVDYVYPELDPVSRTLAVRLRFPNPDHALSPNMFAEVKIYGGPKRDILAIPSEALIVTGKREAVVKVVENGKFQPINVVTGDRRNGTVEILSGLNEDDEIVLSGQFLLDSEASLQASFGRMQGE